MSYYFVASIKINDTTEYQKYLDKAGEIFRKFKGEYLSVDDEPLLLEGEWDYSRLVLIRFDTKADFDKWYNSADYQEILKYRLHAAECNTLLVKGISS